MIDYQPTDLSEADPATDGVCRTCGSHDLYSIEAVVEYRRVPIVPFTRSDGADGWEPDWDRAGPDDTADTDTVGVGCHDCDAQVRWDDAAPDDVDRPTYADLVTTRAAFEAEHPPVDWLVPITVRGSRWVTDECGDEKHAHREDLPEERYLAAVTARSEHEATQAVYELRPEGLSGTFGPLYPPTAYRADVELFDGPDLPRWTAA